MTKSTITRERARQIFLGNGPEPSASEERELARMALAAMGSEPVEMPLDYLQGHKDGLEWAAQLAEANHPETGDWLYDDPIELAKAIRKGPDMPPAQPVADTEPVAWRWRWSDDAEGYWRYTEEQRETRGSVTAQPLYRHAQPAPVVPELRVDWQENEFSAGWNACRAAMLQASPVCTCPSGDGSLRWPCPVHAGSSPVIQDGYVLVPKEATLDMLKAGAKQEMKGEAFQYVWQAMLAAAPQEVMKDEANNLSPK